MWRSNRYLVYVDIIHPYVEQKTDFWFSIFSIDRVDSDESIPVARKFRGGTLRHELRIRKKVEKFWTSSGNFYKHFLSKNHHDALVLIRGHPSR